MEVCLRVAVEGLIAADDIVPKQKRRSKGSIRAIVNRSGSLMEMFETRSHVFQWSEGLDI